MSYRSGLFFVEVTNCKYLISFLNPGKASLSDAVKFKVLIAQGNCETKGGPAKETR